MVEADFQRFYHFDLREEAETAGPRRLWTLIKGLPPESETHSIQCFPLDVEFLATLVERQDAWFDVLLKAQMGAKRVQSPGLLRIKRPGDESEPERKLVSDPNVLLAFFGGR